MRKRLRIPALLLGVTTFYAASMLTWSYLPPTAGPLMGHELNAGNRSQIPSVGSTVTVDGKRYTVVQMIAPPAGFTPCSGDDARDFVVERDGSLTGYYCNPQGLHWESHLPKYEGPHSWLHWSTEAWAVIGSVGAVGLGGGQTAKYSVKSVSQNKDGTQNITATVTVYTSAGFQTFTVTISGLPSFAAY